MNTTIIYLLGLGLIVIINLFLFLFFKPYLKKMLLEQNGGKERPASFWVIYCGIMLILVPLVFAMSIVPEAGNENVFFQISKQLKWSLIGTIVSFFAFGIAIIQFIPKDKNKGAQ